MKAKLVSDFKKRKQFKVNEISQKISKSLSQNKGLPIFQQWWVKLNQANFQANTKVKIKNRCILTGRSKSVSRDYRLSRIQFRELGRAGNITGLRKSSW